jgi:hypothetical protein
MMCFIVFFVIYYGEITNQNETKEGLSSTCHQASTEESFILTFQLFKKERWIFGEKKSRDFLIGARLYRSGQSAVHLGPNVFFVLD